MSQNQNQNDNQTNQNVQTEVVKAKPVVKIYKCKKCGKEFTSRSAYKLFCHPTKS